MRLVHIPCQNNLAARNVTLQAPLACTDACTAHDKSERMRDAMIRDMIVRSYWLDIECLREAGVVLVGVVLVEEVPAYMLLLTGGRSLHFTCASKGIEHEKANSLSCVLYSEGYRNAE